MTGKTWTELGAEYDATRRQIFDAVKSDAVSLSLSGFENFPKEWAELDPRDDMDWSAMADWIGVYYRDTAARRSFVDAWGQTARHLWRRPMAMTQAMRAIGGSSE